VKVGCNNGQPAGNRTLVPPPSSLLPPQLIEEERREGERGKGQDNFILVGSSETTRDTSPFLPCWFYQTDVAPSLLILAWFASLGEVVIEESKDIVQN